MERFGEMIRRLRKEKGEPLRVLAAYLETDQAIISKIERGRRMATKKQVEKLAEYFKSDKKAIFTAWLSDKIVYELEGENFANDALQMAEIKLEYLSKKKSGQNRIVSLMQEYFSKNEKVLKAWIFGSFARAEENQKSDIDIMVQVNDQTPFSLFDLSEIKYQLEKRISRSVDVVMKGALSPRILERINPDIKLIYERSFYKK